jgi:hypothetical protein
MARIMVTTDDGRMTHSERVIPSDLHTEHFRRSLLDRLRWATADAERSVDELAARRARQPGHRAIAACAGQPTYG